MSFTKSTASYAEITSMRDLQNKLKEYDALIHSEIKESVAKKMASETYKKIKTSVDKINDRIMKTPKAMELLSQQMMKNTSLHLMNFILSSYRDHLITSTNYGKFIGVVSQLTQVFKAKGWAQKLKIFRNAAAHFVEAAMPFTGHSAIIQFRHKSGELDIVDHMDMYDLLVEHCDVASVVWANHNTYLIMSLQPETLANIAKTLDGCEVTMTGTESNKEGKFTAKTIAFENTKTIPIHTRFVWKTRLQEKVVSLPTGTSCVSTSIEYLQYYNKELREQE